MKNRIKEIRRDADLTQQEFADRLGIKRGAIANYELGRNAPIDAVISLICREFKINEKWLRTGKGEKKQPEPKSEMDVLAETYNMSRDERIFLEMYLKQNRSERDAIFRFLRNTFAAIENDANNETPEKITNSSKISIDEHKELPYQDFWESCTVEEAEAEYIKSRSKVAKRAELSASNITANTINPKNTIDKAANQ